MFDVLLVCFCRLGSIERCIGIRNVVFEVEFWVLGLCRWKRRRGRLPNT